MTRSDGFTLKGWHVLAGMIAFFAIVLAMDAATIVFAYRSFPGESTRNPYEAGLAYNATLARRSREAALGWRVEAEAVPAFADIELRVEQPSEEEDAEAFQPAAEPRQAMAAVELPAQWSLF